ncbi:MAG: rod shape-determining protein MreD [Vicinamibacterales bacterium]
MSALWLPVAVAAAVGLQTTLDRWLPSGAVDLPLVVVVYAALGAGRVTGLLAGSFAGLVQDALSGGVVGIGGLSKTIVGFLTGVLGTQFIVAHSLSRFVVFFLATLLNAVIFMGLYHLLGLREFSEPVTTIAGQAFGNSVVGVLVFRLAELRPGAVEHRRMSRSEFRR